MVPPLRRQANPPEGGTTNSELMDKTKFQSRLRDFAAVRRRLYNSTLALRLGTLALAALVLGLLLLNGWLPGAFVNLALFAVLAIFLVTLAIRYPLRRMQFRSWLDEAFVMERLAGGLNSRLISAWDFLDRNFITPLTAVVIERAYNDLQFPFESRLDRTERRQRVKQFSIWLVVFLLLAISPWFGLMRMLGNLERSWIAARDYLFPVSYAISPAPGTHIHRLGEKVDVQLRFDRRAYDGVKLISHPVDGKPTSIDLAVDEQGKAHHKLGSDVEAEYALHFEFGERRSEDVRLVFTTAPSLVNMQSELVYPVYTGMLPRSLEGVQQRLLSLSGTRMTLGFTFSKELESATITWEDGQELPLEIVGRFASVGLLHNKARQAKLQVRDIHGLAMDYPLLIDFELQNDEKPQLVLPRHLKEDMPVLEPAVALFGFGARAQDDYGVTRCLLRWRKSTVDSPTSIQDQGEVERLISPSQRTAVISFEKVFAGLSLKPGDKVTFEVEAYDNRMPEKQLTRSRRFSFFVYQPELDSLTIKELGFGGAGDMREGRIAKSVRATSVKAPEGLRTREQVWNEHQANVASSAQAPTLRGEFGQATQDYFKLLSKVNYTDEKPGDRNTAPPAANISETAPGTSP